MAVIYEVVAPRGLGDAIYQRAVVEHILSRGDEVKVWTYWRDLFEDLPVKLATKQEIDDLQNKKDLPDHNNLHAVSACMHCRVPYIMGLDKFTLACLQAGIEEPIELRISWKVRKPDLLRMIQEKADGRPIMVYQSLRKGRTPDDHVMRPKLEAYRAFINDHADHFRVKLGHHFYVDRTTDLPCELDLTDATMSPTWALDIIYISNLVFGENCYTPIAAQAMNRPFVLMMAREATRSNRPKVRGVLPHRMIQKPHLGKVVFDE